MRKKFSFTEKKYVNKKLRETEVNLNRLARVSQSFNYLQISLTSSEQIRSWNKKRLFKKIIKGVINTQHIDLERKLFIGTIEEALTQDFLVTKFGLFSQVIFGPIKDWLCECKKYNGNTKNYLLGLICPNCNVEITSTKVRRYRMGYIDLSIPIIHSWYIELISNLVYVILNLTLSRSISNIPIKKLEGQFEKIIFQPALIESICFLEKPDYYNGNLLKYFNDVKIFFKHYFKFYSEKIGVEFLLDYLKDINFSNLYSNMNTNNTIHNSPNYFYIRLLKNFIAINNRPEWIMLTALPVLPPSARPYMKSYKRNGKKHSALTRFYEHISYTSTFFYLFSKKKDISEFIQFSKELQLGLNRLIDNSRLPKTMQLMTNKRPDTSLTQAFLGKFGQFRYNMLGKRVNFSGRSVIITGPTLHLYQCQLPYSIALTLFMPHLMLFLKERSPSTIYFKVDWEELIANQCFFFYKVLGIVIEKYLVMLNRAPTLHRFNIQSFNPILTLNKTISLHPLVCTGFNADFDGDQMAVHLPLYNISQVESHMIHSPRVLTPANGDVILKPSQDIVIGSCYLSILLKKNRNLFFKYFDKYEDIYLLHSQKKMDLHMPILLDLVLDNIYICKEKAGFIIKNNNFEALTYKTKVIKCIKSLNFIYLFLDCGVLLTKKINKKYIILKFFLKTTPGRIFFENSMSNLVKIT